ncbi:hypothetical protein GYH30_051947 [Glycine max]|uniref:UDP-glycosyltransferases domain-containing protein n=1 Tax=Glycine max TaxID=3847 RepID=K7MWC7_SOYBN|nr:hypothetical protein GYH30_051947 [Glycine max]
MHKELKYPRECNFNKGHINPLFRIAKLLHLRGFHITFVNTEYNHKCLLNSRGPKALEGLQDFHFETIPDGLPLTDEDADVTQDIVSLCKSVRENMLIPFHELLARLHDSDTAGLIPPVTCLVSDVGMAFTIHAAEELALPIVLFPSASAGSLLSCLHLRALIDKGLIPLKVDWYENFRLKDLIDIIRTTDPNDFMVEFFIEVTDNVHRGSAIVINTSHELESSNLWKENTEGHGWLESEEPKSVHSVVYVNFGSITVLSPEQLLEFARGLANSKRPFCGSLGRALSLAVQ